MDRDRRDLTPETWIPDSRTSRVVLASVRDATGLIQQMLRSEPHQAISLGQNCNSAWYLKQLGARLSAGPFDWIFSSAEIADSCLRDEFATLLDKAQIVPRGSGGSAGHLVYHDHLFPHRSPIRSDEDYAYHVRAAQRFLDTLTSGAPIVFVCTLLDEQDIQAVTAAFRDEFEAFGYAPLATGRAR